MWQVADNAQTFQDFAIGMLQSYEKIFYANLRDLINASASSAAEDCIFL